MSLIIIVLLAFCDEGDDQRIRRRFARVFGSLGRDSFHSSSAVVSLPRSPLRSSENQEEWIFSLWLQNCGPSNRLIPGN